MLFLLPVVMPRGKWLLWSSLVIGALIGIVWAQHIYVTTKPDYTGNAIGAALTIGVTALWMLGLTVRYIIWLFQLKREEKIEKQLEAGNLLLENDGHGRHKRHPR